MGQISIPVMNKSGYSMFWNSMWDSKHNYNIFLKQDIFIKNSLHLFFEDYSSNKLFLFLKNNNKKNNFLKFNNYFQKDNIPNIDVFFSKIWLLRINSWVIINLSIFNFKPQVQNKYNFNCIKIVNVLKLNYYLIILLNRNEFNLTKFNF